MTSDLAESLATIDSALQRLDRQALRRALQPGVAGSEIRASLGSVGLAAPSELEELYVWRDGTSTAGVTSLDDLHLVPGFYLLSLADAIANYQAFVADPRWMAGWLPVFANGGGDFYVVEVSSPGESPVRHFRIDEADHPIEFSSLGAMLATVAQGFERGTFFVDPDGYLEMDDLAFGALAAELNPDVEWWRD